ncbi:hypothetical protein PHYSODRAFT_454155, partial [Phytophthora sojae]
MKLAGALLRARRPSSLRFAVAANGGQCVAPKSRIAGLSTSSSPLAEDKKSILELLQRVAEGKVSPQAAAELCGPAAEYETVGDFAKIDTKREARTGFPEVVYAESKTPEQVAAIMKVMIDGGEDNVMASRVTPEAADAIQALMPGQHLTYYEVPRILASKSLDAAKKEESTEDQEKKTPTACVLCAGTSDLPVAEEAAVTLELADYKVTQLYDVGVAGIHRLLRNQHVLRASDVAICVAGMDGALPGVVGGLTSSPVIAVPTSVGYGAAFGGLAPLLTMLNACSPGVGVVNIDNGFGAAVLADEQLKRIAEFGRVHGTVVQEAKQYVSNMEVQLSRQFEEERAALRAQAEE